MKKIFIVFVLFSLIGLSMFSQINFQDGLVGYYQLNGNVIDSSGNGNNGILVTASLTNDRFSITKTAFYFNGAGDYLKLPNIIGNSFTVVFWTKTSMVASSGSAWYSGHGMVDAEMFGPKYDWGISLIDSGKVAFGIGPNDLTIKSGVNINNNKWNMVTGTRDIATGEFKIFINGVLSACDTSHTSGLTSASFIGVGNSPNNADLNIRWYNGSIDDIRMYNRVLDSAEIKALYNENCSRKHYDDVLLYKVSDKSFEEIDTVNHYLQTDTAVVHDSCTCITRRIYRFQYQENVYSDTTFVNDTIFIKDTTYVTVEDTLDILITQSAIDQTIISHIRVFPNPVHDKLNIDIGEFGNLSGYSIKIVNNASQTVWNSNITQQNYIVNMDALGGAGMYYLQIFDAGLLLKTQKVIRLK